MVIVSVVTHSVTEAYAEPLSSQTVDVLSPLPEASFALGGAEQSIIEGVALDARDASIETLEKESVIEGDTEALEVIEVATFINPVPLGELSQGLHGHNGVDLRAPVGTPVRASRGGVVKVSLSSGWNGGFGSYIIIEHADGTESLYAHLSANYVSSGATVVQGDSIGEIGMTGRTTGAHLHFEIHGTSNPFSY